MVFCMYFFDAYEYVLYGVSAPHSHIVSRLNKLALLGDTHPILRVRVFTECSPAHPQHFLSPLSAWNRPDYTTCR